jgi:uncharacterized protein (DUF934 family)
MQKLNRNGELTPFEWQQAVKETAGTEIQNGGWLLPTAQFIQMQDNLPSNTGVVIHPDDDLESLEQIINNAAAVAIDFPSFTDGRGFSTARMVRSRLNFKGELIAVGQFMLDQLHYLKRCGFDAFAVSDDAKVQTLLDNLSDFSDAYQASADEPLPLFQRRGN